MGQKYFLNPCQTAFSSMGKCGLAVRVDCCDISARVDQQLCHFGAIILLRGVHDQRGHPVELDTAFLWASVLMVLSSFAAYLIMKRIGIIK